MTSLSEIQKALKAPKGQFNAFGKYHYRNCEDILEAVKPLLGDSIILISDELVHIGDRYYIKATATFKSKKPSLNSKSLSEWEYTSVSAYAREPLSKKGMDESQLTGSTSSYARKYALNGLLLIDDNKDADALPPRPVKTTPKDKLRDEIGHRTNGYKDKDKISEICKAMGIDSLQDLKDRSDEDLEEMIAFLSNHDFGVI